MKAYKAVSIVISLSLLVYTAYLANDHADKTGQVILTNPSLAQTFINFKQHNSV